MLTVLLLIVLDSWIISVCAREKVNTQIYLPFYHSTNPNDQKDLSINLSSCLSTCISSLSLPLSLSFSQCACVRERESQYKSICLSTNPDDQNDLSIHLSSYLSTCISSLSLSISFSQCACVREKESQHTLSSFLLFYLSRRSKQFIYASIHGVATNSKLLKIIRLFCRI